MPYKYDNDNIFARILRDELPCNKVLETQHSLAFEDITPITAHHVLVIPKGKYVCFDDFANNASGEEIIDYIRAIAQVAQILGVTPDSGGNGYRLLSNTGKDAVQMVAHFHVHLAAGQPLGPMLTVHRGR